MWGWSLASLAAVVLVLQGVRQKRMALKAVPQTQAEIQWGWLLIQLAAIFGFTLVMNAYEGIPAPVLLMLVLMVVFQFVSTKTVFGRHVYAVGGSVEAAYLSGVNVRRVVLGNFLLMGLLTGVAAMILTARVESAQPDAGQLLELDAVASCVIGGTSLMGGKGTIAGALLGALVMESLNNGMSLANMEAFWQYVVKGLVLVVAVWLDVASQKVH
jgi:D-xylose transport system permease protein